MPYTTILYYHLKSYSIFGYLSSKGGDIKAMFIYFKRQEQKEGKRITIRRIDEGNFFYFEILAQGKCGKRKILRADRLCGSHLPVASIDSSLPQRMAKRMISSDRFMDFLLVNTFCEVALGQKSALVYDPDGRYSSYLLRLLTVTRTLYIFSPCPIYETLCETALERVGASPVILKDLGARSFPAALAGGEGARARLTIGEGGFMPICDTVFYKKNWGNFDLCAAKFEVWRPENFPHFLPSRLKNKSLSLTPSQLKKMLDTF